MTRINCIPVDELSDAHLGAEYRELPRVFGLVRCAIARGEAPTDPRNPREYCLGPGHVRFFYPRLMWLHDRFYALVNECRKRGRTVNFPKAPAHGIPDEWFGDWEPTPAALALNRQRLRERS